MDTFWQTSCAPTGVAYSPFDFTQGRLWHPDSLLTRQMRAKVSWIQHLTRATIRLSNRLRAVLLRYYPAALRVFPDLSTQIALEFIRAYPTPQTAARLTLAELMDFAQQQGYSHPKKLSRCYAHLKGDYPEASPETVSIYQDEAVQLASLLLQMTRTRKEVRYFRGWPMLTMVLHELIDRLEGVKRK